MKENIKGFCVNNYQNSNKELIVLTNRRLKKFNLLNQLINKTRTNDGITLLDEVIIALVINSNLVYI